ncbi:MAG: SRPBCC family protein [Acidimicrobiales bacterium]
MYAETSVDIDAPPADVWRVLIDVERMPTWTESVSKAESRGGGEFAVGATERLTQPRQPAMVSEVTELEPEASFTWSIGRGGLTTSAGHHLRANEAGTTEFVLPIDQHGPMAVIVGLFTSKLIVKTTSNLMPIAVAAVGAAWTVVYAKRSRCRGERAAEAYRAEHEHPPDPPLSGAL